MAGPLFWFVLAFVLVVVELMTGTFYVLMIAIAFAAGGATAWLGGAVWAQFLAASLVGALATLVLRRSRVGKASRHADHATDAEQNLDIGQAVAVVQWTEEGTTRVQYRGTQWDAVLAEGEPRDAARYYIRAVHGARLTLASQST
jgi:membrane protein implicated in regulation of membrane protease activity